MAKKIRFPLEMENGVEVRSMEELRDNFSISKVLSYLQEGKLVTWLRDRYINDIADSIEKLDLQDEELAKKIYELFDVPYDETTENEVEQAAERAERILLLKNYTDDKQYEAVIDNVAFDQDELYDRLDEDVDTIYLCGEKFDIPLAKPGITYMGINNPVAVIDSKVEINWETIGISVKNVTFDEKYQAVLDRANEMEETLEVPDTKNLSDSTQRELAEFLSLIVDKVEELHDREWDYKRNDTVLAFHKGNDDICKKFKLDFHKVCNCDFMEIQMKYCNGELLYYPSRTNAKHAYRKPLEILINDVKERYQAIRNKRYEEIMKNCGTVNANISEILEDIIADVDDFIGDCEDGIAIQKIRKLLQELNLNEKMADYSMVEQASALTAKLLPEKTTAIKKISDYLERHCSDGRIDGNCCVFLDQAASEMIDDVNNAANEAIDKLYDGLEIIYQDIVDALGVFILKSAYNRLVLGAENVRPTLLNVDELAEKIPQNNVGDSTMVGMIKSISHAINHVALGVQGEIPDKDIKLSEQNISDNGKALADTINQVKEYLRKIRQNECTN